MHTRMCGTEIAPCGGKSLHHSTTVHTAMTGFQHVSRMAGLDRASGAGQRISWNARVGWSLKDLPSHAVGYEKQLE